MTDNIQTEVLAGADVSAKPRSVSACSDAVDLVLACFLAERRQEWRGVDPAMGDLIDAVDALVSSGGKRLRPAFSHWAFVGAGGDPDDEVDAQAGAALEMLHSFALLHDDVMDGAATRRGRPTAHAAFARRHEQEGWQGDAHRFGESVAILAGDLAFVWADQLLPSGRPDVARLWNLLRSELAVGQYLDVLGGAQGDVSEPAARRIIRFKSAKYSVERPLHLGAAVAGRLDELAPLLSAVGLPLGDAFQLRDDVLGAFGDEAVTGKPVGDDLREGKPTVLVALAREHHGPHHPGLRGYGDIDLDTDGVARIQDHLVASGAVDRVEALISSLAEEAFAAIARLPFDADVRSMFEDLTTIATHRDR